MYAGNVQEIIDAQQTAVLLLIHRYLVHFRLTH